MFTREEEASVILAKLAWMTEHKVSSDNGFKAIGTQGISQETLLALIDPLNNFLRPCLVVFIHTTLCFLVL